MKEEITNYLLGNTSLSFILAFYFLAVLGIIFSMTAHVYKKKIKRKDWSWKFLLADNTKRFIASIIAIYVVLIGWGYLAPDKELHVVVGFFLGGSLDRVVIELRNRTPINFFQK